MHAEMHMTRYVYVLICTRNLHKRTHNENHTKEQKTF